ncbi:hypothetical protein NUW54_g7211 [Trametes sanguinea]|uniref:Uncharacterized protein n=1 Tax=Trametes sanguinea TaxID=158606 RepID=A0ACC1PNX4_9APHY|nr:hypothetical protein NUW54_g7211 [Trametes sanguinea]
MLEEEAARRERDRAQLRAQQASLEPLLRAFGFVPVSTSGSDSDSDKVINRRGVALGTVAPHPPDSVQPIIDLDDSSSPRYTDPRTQRPPRLLPPSTPSAPNSGTEATTAAGNLPIPEDADMDNGSAATSTSSLPVDDHRSDNSDVLSTPSER